MLEKRSKILCLFSSQFTQELMVDGHHNGIDFFGMAEALICQANEDGAAIVRMAPSFNKGHLLQAVEDTCHGGARDLELLTQYVRGDAILFTQKVQDHGLGRGNPQVGDFLCPKSRCSLTRFCQLKEYAILYLH